MVDSKPLIRQRAKPRREKGKIGGLT